MKDIETLIAACDAAHVQSSASYFGTVSFHVQGLVDCSVFIRVRTKRQAMFNKSVLIISTIETEVQGTGLGTAIIEALEAHCQSRDWVLMFESVVNPRFRKFLYARGFVSQAGHDERCGNVFWLPKIKRRRVVA